MQQTLTKTRLFLSFFFFSEKVVMFLLFLSGQTHVSEHIYFIMLIDFYSLPTRVK